MISPKQSKAARALLGWTQGQLAETAGVGISTVRDFELGQRKPIARNRAAILNAFEAAGIEFISPNGGGPGVRLQE
ncbi:MAG: helix-turn-helix domain-containing protein [Sphingomonadales bacterium]|nr:helix-turn-helix domain-containing protein [Sphingomonadales bacterium]